MVELLNKMILIDIEINLKTKEIEKWRSMRERITIQLQENKVSSGGGVQDKLGELTACILDLESELVDDVKKATEYRKDFEKIISKLENPQEYNMMYRRYILFQPWGTIAKEMHYSKDGLMKMHNRVLQNLNGSETKEYT
jgi:hypothetical protein